LADVKVLLDLSMVEDLKLPVLKPDAPPVLVLLFTPEELKVDLDAPELELLFIEDEELNPPEELDFDVNELLDLELEDDELTDEPLAFTCIVVLRLKNSTSRISILPILFTCFITSLPIECSSKTFWHFI
jgi:hypothetical protein